MTGISQGGDVVDGDIDAAGSEAEGDEGKKRKSPNMYRLLKSRLQKLIAKSDDTYVLSHHLKARYSKRAAK